LKIPQQVPLTGDGGAVWGIAVGPTGSSGSDRTPRGPEHPQAAWRRGRRDGCRERPAQHHEGRRPCDRRATKLPTAATGAAVEPSRARFASAARLRAWRWLGWRSERASTERSDLRAGPIAKRASVMRSMTDKQARLSPATGTGRRQMTAGYAGLAVLRQGRKPVRGETPVPVTRRAARQPGRAQRGDTQTRQPFAAPRSAPQSPSTSTAARPAPTSSNENTSPPCRSKAARLPPMTS